MLRTTESALGCRKNERRVCYKQCTDGPGTERMEFTTVISIHVTLHYIHVEFLYNTLIEPALDPTDRTTRRVRCIGPGPTACALLESSRRTDADERNQGLLPLPTTRSLPANPALAGPPRHSVHFRPVDVFEDVVIGFAFL